MRHVFPKSIIQAFALMTRMEAAIIRSTLRVGLAVVAVSRCRRGIAARAAGLCRQARGAQGLVARCRYAASAELLIWIRDNARRRPSPEHKWTTIYNLR
eukprot:1950787-Pleurochrysis_carterae.AAC.4